MTVSYLSQVQGFTVQVIFGLLKEHQWDNIDMNEFIKYDWNEVYALNLTGSGMDDAKWQLFVENANLFL